MNFPDHYVREATRVAVEAVNDATLSTPTAAIAGRRGLSPLLGFKTGDAFASALFISAAPDRMAVYDSRAQAGLMKLEPLYSEDKELKHTIETQRSEIRSLRGERSRWLGGQVEQLAGPSQELIALQDALNYSLVERDKLQNLASDHSRRADQLDRTLNAARQAYKEVFAAKQHSFDNVVSIDGTDKKS